MSIYDNKFVGKLTDKDIIMIEKMVSNNRDYSFISEKTVFYSGNKHELDIVPGSKMDGILLVEAMMETTKKYNLTSNYFYHS